MDNKLRWQLMKYVVKVSQASDTPISELIRQLIKDNNSTIPNKDEDDVKFYEDMLQAIKAPYKIPEIPVLIPGEIEEELAPPTRRE